jgi:hypothetical protein
MWYSSNSGARLRHPDTGRGSRDSWLIGRSDAAGDRFVLADNPEGSRKMGRVESEVPWDH